MGLRMIELGSHFLGVEGNCKDGKGTPSNQDNEKRGVDDQHVFDLKIHRVKPSLCTLFFFHNNSLLESAKAA